MGKAQTRERWARRQGWASPQGAHSLAGERHTQAQKKYKQKEASPLTEAQRGEQAAAVGCLMQGGTWGAHRWTAQGTLRHGPGKPGERPPRLEIKTLKGNRRS